MCVCLKFLCLPSRIFFFFCWFALTNFDMWWSFLYFSRHIWEYVLGPVLLNRIPDTFLGFRTVKQIGFDVLIKKDKSLIEKWVHMIKNNYIKLSKNYRLWIKKEPLHLFPKWLPHFALLPTVTKCFAFHICKPVFVDILLLFLATLTRIG